MSSPTVEETGLTAAPRGTAEARPLNGSPSIDPAPHEAGPHETVVIEPSKAWAAVRWREVWAYRELLYFLAWRDIKIRYKQSALGAAWAILQPLATMLIFTTLLGRAANLSHNTGGVPYALSTYAALVPWMFFSGAVAASGNSLVGSANLISKVYFPRMIVPGAAVGATLVDFGIAFSFLLPLSMVYGRLPSLSTHLLMLPVLIALLFVLSLSVGMWMSALNVKFRDVKYALPFLLQIGMFASPVFFPLNSPQVPSQWRSLLVFNPMSGILEGFRSALFNLPFHWGALGVSALITAGLAVYALLAFRRMESSFADVI